MEMSRESVARGQNAELQLQTRREYPQAITKLRHGLETRSFWNHFHVRGLLLVSRGDYGQEENMTF